MANTDRKSRDAALEIVGRYVLSGSRKKLQPTDTKVQVAARYWPEAGLRSREFQYRYPDQEQLIRMAAMTTKGLVQFWQPWHMEKTHAPERISDPVNWTAAPNGDEEWPHALARFTHMFDLAAGYMLSRNVDMIAAFNRHLDDFYAARGDEGDLWGNRLDSSLRLLNLIRAHDLLRDESEFGADNQLVCFALMLRECQLLHHGLGSRVGNWEFFITTSLLCATIYLERVFEVARWHSDAMARLHEIIQSEILGDGNLVEQVPMYHGVCVLALLDFLVVQKANNKTLDREVVACVNRMVDVLIKIADPDGRIPTIGDSDVFDVMYITDYCDVVLATNHSAALEKAITGVANGHPRIENLTASGWTIVRWQGRDNKLGYLLFDLSGKPRDGREGHSHADDLQFLFHNGSQPILIDPGRFTYTSLFLSGFTWLPWRLRHSRVFRSVYSLLRPRFKDMNDRNWNRYFRHTLRHNTVSCDGMNQFGYDDSPTKRSRVLTEPPVSAGPMVLCRASLDSEPDYLHTRTFICQLPHYMVIVDRLSSPEPHNWIVSFHLGTALQVTADQQTVRALATDGSSHSLLFTESSGTPLEISVIGDWVSPEYNLKEPANAVQVRLSNRAEANFVSILSLDPNRNPLHQAAVQIRQDRRSDSAWAELQFPTDDGEFVGLVRLKGSQIISDEIATDAYYASFRRVGKKTTEFGYLDGSYLELGGERRANVGSKSLHTLIG
ncbi:MAG: alginate lyase family protein [Candidatus Zixiibacteriota bacterium]